MTMKKQTKILKLTRETLVQLDAAKLNEAVGGRTLPHSDVPTYTCTSHIIC